MITALRRRTTYLFALLLTGSAFALAWVNAPLASAWVVPDHFGANPSAPVASSLPAAPAHSSSASGLAIWLVVVISLAALAIGFGLSELARFQLRNRRGRRVAMATS